MVISPRQARDKEELKELCTDSYDRSSVPLQINHDYLRHITASNLSLKARQLFVWFTENVIRRNFVITTTSEMGEVIGDSKHLSKYISELEEKRLIYITNKYGNTRLIEVHPAIAFKGWHKRREQYLLDDWLATVPIYIRDK